MLGSTVQDLMKRPHHLILMSVLAPLVVLVACGSDATTVSAGDGSSEESSPETTVSPEESLPEESLPLGGGSYPVATFAVTVSHPEHDDITYEIVCLGDTATVVPGNGESGISEIAACTTLGTDAARTRLIDGVPADQICTDLYGGADVARIVGEYDGVGGIPVDATIDRSNGCGIADWDIVLAGVLPPSRGL